MKYSTTKDVMLLMRQNMMIDNIQIKELAKRLNKSASSVTMVFKQSNVTLETLNDMCEALGYELHIDIVTKREMEKTG